MPDPFCLRDMDAATERLRRAVMAHEKVAIFGDYDVDGACSAALLSEYLNACGLETIVHIPDRVTEGYGPNVEAIQDFAVARRDARGDRRLRRRQPRAVRGREPAWPRCDRVRSPSGPGGAAEDGGARRSQPRGRPFRARLSLRRGRRLHGARGAQPRVARSRLLERRQRPGSLASLDLVALATVADVVPLIGLNRAFVVKGLAIMRERRRPGLAALFDIAGADGPPRPYHLGFVIGPRINAGGRIGDAALGVRLLTAADDIEARTIAVELDRLNRIRQQIEIEALAEAEAEALLSLGLEERGAAVVVAGATWPPGVVGLLAARLKERFERPAFALSLAGGQATGSGRSIVGVDLGRAVRAAIEAGVAIKGGGHAMAAGVTLASERLGDWRAFLEERLGQAVTKARAEAGLKVDAALTATAATPELVHRLEAAGPYGAGAPEPVFALPRHRLAEVTPVGVEGRHLRLRAVAGDGRAVEGIAFRASGKKLGEALIRLKGAPVHLAGTLSVNRFGGRERAQIRVVDVAEATQ